LHNIQVQLNTCQHVSCEERKKTFVRLNRINHSQYNFLKNLHYIQVQLKKRQHVYYDERKKKQHVRLNRINHSQSNLLILPIHSH
jgi:hypothetical protein